MIISDERYIPMPSERRGKLDLAFHKVPKDLTFLSTATQLIQVFDPFPWTKDVAGAATILIDGMIT